MCHIAPETARELAELAHAILEADAQASPGPWGGVNSSGQQYQTPYARLLRTPQGGVTANVVGVEQCIFPGKIDGTWNINEPLAATMAMASIPTIAIPGQPPGANITPEAGAAMHANWNFVCLSRNAAPVLARKVLELLERLDAAQAQKENNDG